MTSTVLPADFNPLVPDGFGLFAGVFGFILIAFGILFIGVVAFIIVTAVRRANVIKQAGYDPLTIDAQVATQVLGSELLRPATAPAPRADAAVRSTAERLAELDDLVSRGVISDAERTAARAAILAG